MLEIILESSRQELIQKGKQKIREKYKKKIEDNREEYKEKIKEKAKDYLKDRSDEAEEDFYNKRGIYMTAFNNKVKNLLKMQDQDIDAYVKKVSKLTPKQLTVVISATVLIALSYQAARAIHKHSEDVCFKIKDQKKRSLCTKKYEYEFYKKRYNFLRDNITRCKFAKNPVLCNRILNRELSIIKDKLIELRTEILTKYAGVKS